MPRLTAMLFTLFALAVGGCGSHVAPAVPQGATIKSVSFHSTTVVIHGDPIVFDVTLHNPSATMVSPFLIQGWLQQGAAWRAASGSYAWCGDNAAEVLPQGDCTFSSDFNADDSNASSYGSGTFIPGPATAVIELRIDLVPEDIVIDSVSVPITLTN